MKKKVIRFVVLALLVLIIASIAVNADEPGIFKKIWQKIAGGPAACGSEGLYSDAAKCGENCMTGKCSGVTVKKMSCFYCPDAKFDQGCDPGLFSDENSCKSECDGKCNSVWHATDRKCFFCDGKRLTPDPTGTPVGPGMPARSCAEEQLFADKGKCDDSCMGGCRSVRWKGLDCFYCGEKESNIQCDKGFFSSKTACDYACDGKCDSVWRARDLRCWACSGTLVAPVPPQPATPKTPPKVTPKLPTTPKPKDGPEPAPATPFFCPIGLSQYNECLKNCESPEKGTCNPDIEAPGCYFCKTKEEPQTTPKDGPEPAPATPIFCPPGLLTYNECITTCESATAKTKGGCRRDPDSLGCFYCKPYETIPKTPKEEPKTTPKADCARGGMFDTKTQCETVCTTPEMYCHFFPSFMIKDAGCWTCTKEGHRPLQDLNCNKYGTPDQNQDYNTCKSTCPKEKGYCQGESILKLAEGKLSPDQIKDLKDVRCYKCVPRKNPTDDGVKEGPLTPPQTPKTTPKVPTCDQIQTNLGSLFRSDAMCELSCKGVCKALTATHKATGTKIKCYACVPIKTKPTEPKTTPKEEPQTTPQPPDHPPAEYTPPKETNCVDECAKKGLSLTTDSNAILTQLNQYRCVSGVHTSLTTTMVGNCKCYSTPKLDIDQTPVICKNTPCGDIPCDGSVPCACPDKPNCKMTVTCKWNGWRDIGGNRFMAEVYTPYS